MFLAFGLLLPCILAPVQSEKVAPLSVSLSLDAPLVTLSPVYAGFTLDWWPPKQENFSTSTVPLIDFTHPRLLGLTAALGPATLRVGGSLDNAVRYLVGPMSPSYCAAEQSFRGLKVSLCLNLTRMQQLLDFVSHVPRSELVFGLQLDLGISGEGPWNSSNVLDFIQALPALRGSSALRAVEVGEETTPAPGSSGFAAQQAAYAGVAAALGRGSWPAAPPLLLGPATGMAPFNYAPFAWPRAFLQGLAAQGTPLGGYVMHSYNNDGGGGWVGPGLLNETAVQAAGLSAFLRDPSSGAPPGLGLWCGECGPHNGGGRPGLTDTAMSSFWFFDALLGLPMLGVTRFNRQTLSGGNYGLLKTGSFLPNPDYFVAFSHAQLVNGRVLGVNFSSPLPPTLGIYARCARGGGVALAFVNVHPLAAINLTSAEGAQGRLGGLRTDYLFTPTGGNPRASTLSCNGVALEVTGNSPPQLVGAPADARAGILIPPQSFGFAVFPEAAAEACA